jgi:hypothetical protein
MRFYLAMLQQEEVDAESCLRRHGFPEEKARLLLDNAKLHRSPSIFAPVDDTRAILICPHPDTGRLCSWRAITEQLEQGEAEEVLEGLKAAHPGET